MQGTIGSFADALAAGDCARMTALRPRAAECPPRRCWRQAWVPLHREALEVRIPYGIIAPAAVAEVTTIASSVGCNIQSIEIDHITA